MWAFYVPTMLAVLVATAAVQRKYAAPTVPWAGLLTSAPSTVYLDSPPVVPANEMPAPSREAVGAMSTTAVKSRPDPTGLT